MKKLIMALVAGFVVAGAGLSYAACCKGAADKAGPCGMAKKECYLVKSLAQLNLDAETKAKVDPILASCKNEKCSKEACDKAMKELEGVLSADQFSQLKESCKKACEGKGKKAGCCAKTEKSEKSGEQKSEK